MTKRLTLRRKLAPRVEPPAPAPAPPMEDEYYQRCENTRPEPPPSRHVREDGRSGRRRYMATWEFLLLQATIVGVFTALIIWTSS